MSRLQQSRRNQIQQLAVILFYCWQGGTPWVPNTLIAQDKTSSGDVQAAAVIDSHLKSVKPLEIAANRAWWDANISGSDEAFAAKVNAQNSLDKALGNKERFEQIKKLRDAGLNDPVLKRQFQLLYLIYLEKQVDSQLLEEMTSTANAIEKAFNVYRAVVDGQALADSQVREALSTSKDSLKRKQIWEASKGVGAVVEKDLKKLVSLRNKAAKSLGFKDFHDMSLRLNEQTQTDVLKLFDELDELTREPFARVKADIDQRLAKSYGIAVSELRPWHYHDPFFQEPPSAYDTNLDSAFEKANILAICGRFYSGIGLPIDDVLQRSDLYEKAGKSPHAFCTDIDREGDVRVLANIVPNQYWMTTMLHELGHSVYSSKNIPSSLPYLLRTDAHILATEGVAMMFERLASSSKWLAGMGVTVDDPAAYDATAKRMRKNKLLIFSRWCQVMFRFEMSMYSNPEQDLNQLWWSLVKKYQLQTSPEGRNAPDYGSKIHIVSAPAYYHNYMLGELFACQVHAAIAREVLGNSQPSAAVYFDDPKVGQFMKSRVFEHGRLHPWNSLTEKATGSSLSAQAFAAEFAAE